MKTHGTQKTTIKTSSIGFHDDHDPELFVALDVDETRKAEAIAETLSGIGVGFKIGPRLILREGKDIIQSIARSGDVFVDCKHLDIPSTMVAAVRAAFEAGARYSTIHASCGAKALREIQSMQKDYPQTRVLAVTVLTSFDAATLPFAWRDHSIADIVMGLAKDCANESHTSFVCSPHEVKALKTAIPDGFFVTPGVRPAGTSSDDQSRIETPAQAAANGASSLVVGRPILEAKDPLKVALTIQNEFRAARAR